MLGTLEKQEVWNNLFGVGRVGDVYEYVGQFRVYGILAKSLAAGLKKAGNPPNSLLLNPKRPPLQINLGRDKQFDLGARVPEFRSSSLCRFKSGPTTRSKRQFPIA